MTAVSTLEQFYPLDGSYNTGSREASSFFQKLLELILGPQSKSIWQEGFDRTDIFNEIYQVYEECCEENWDGYDALPISPAVLLEAFRFIIALPQRLPSPEIVPEPAGDIGFEWHYGENRIFVASVNGTKYIAYAGIFGIGVETHGTEVFDGSIPEILIEHISRISE